MEDRNRDHRSGVATEASELPAPSKAANLARGGVLGLAVLLALGYAGWSLWRSKATADLGQRIATIAQPGDIQMISSVTCSYCTVARRWFTVNKVAFSECFIETDKTCAAAYEATLARGTPTLIVRGQMQLGFDAATVLRTLEAPR
jgi:glutaredoxin